MKTILINLLVIVAISCNKKKEDDPQPQLRTLEVVQIDDTSNYYNLYKNDSLIYTRTDEGESTKDYFADVQLTVKNDTSITQFIAWYTINKPYQIVRFDSSAVREAKILKQGTNKFGKKYLIVGNVEQKINNQNMKIVFRQYK